MSGATERRAGRQSRSEVEQRRRILHVAKRVAATLGSDYFRSLTEHLATSLEVDCVYVAELIEGPRVTLQSLAVYCDGAPAENFPQQLTGAAAEHILLDGSIAWSKDVAKIFPVDLLFGRMRAEACVGVRLSDTAGRVIGVIALIARQPLQDVAVAKSALEAFAPRTAAELERKRADDLLRENEERYRAFISSSSDAMWRIEFVKPIPLDAPEGEQIERIYQDGFVAECNDAMARLCGKKSADDLVGERFSTLFPRSDDRMREELRSTVRARYSSGTYATTPLGPDGNVVYRLRTQCGIVENNELLRLWGITRDVTELKRAQMAVEASERRFREVLETIGIPAVMLDRVGNIVFCNEPLGRIAQTSSAELKGRNWLDRIEEPKERERWSALLSGESDMHFEEPLHLRGAEPRLIVWDAILLRDESGSGAILAAIGRDVTGERALEARLAQAERLQSIGRVSAGIAHDFKNLLTVIIGRVSMALEQVEPDVPLHDTLKAVESAAHDCSHLTEQLLIVGRRQQFRPEVTNWNALIDAERETIERIVGSGVTVIYSLDPALATMWADPSQLRRVLMNLTFNARDAMPQGGVLTLATSNVDDAVRLLVSDTGTGLTEYVRTHMFDPFFTTKTESKGSGLGLSIVHGIVSQSGGQISAGGASGEGASFEILLPKVAGTGGTTTR